MTLLRRLHHNQFVRIGDLVNRHAPYGIEGNDPGQHRIFNVGRNVYGGDIAVSLFAAKPPLWERLSGKESKKFTQKALTRSTYSAQ